jgi:hypothetical protein
MIVAMSPAIEIALRKHVERAVRPVRAGRDRKLAMREELLAHLTAIYFDELKQQPDEQTAMAAAVQRFGEPAALTAWLNASAGFMDRYAYSEDLFACCFSPHSGESLVRFAFRLLLAWGIATSIVILGAALLDSTVVRIFKNDPTTYPALVNLYLLLVFGPVAAVVGTWNIARTLQHGGQLSRWLRALALAFFWSLAAIALVAVFWWSFTGTLAGFQRIAGRAAVWGVAGLAVAWGPLPFALLLSGWVLHAGQKYRQKYEVWTTLAIDE